MKYYLNIRRVRKGIAFVRFFIRFGYFKRCDCRNYCYPGAKIRGWGKLFLGHSNIFQERSLIFVETEVEGESIALGNHNTVSAYALLRSHGGTINIGDHNFVGERVQIQGRGGVDIGNHCMIAAGTFISSSSHDFSEPEALSFLKRELPARTTIGDFVWIGTNSVVVAGVNIGHHSIIAAGTIVRNDVEPFTIVGGNPGRVIKRYSHSEREWVLVKERGN